MKLFWGIVVFISVTCFTPLAFGQVVGWVNGGNDTNWTNQNNWTTGFAIGTIPGPTSNVGIFPGFTASPSVAGTVSLSLGGTSNIIINSSTNQTINTLLISASFGSQNASSTSNPSVALNFNGSTLTTFEATVTGDATLNFTGSLTVLDGVIVGTNINQNPGGPAILGQGTMSMSNGTFNIANMGVGEGTNGVVSQQSGANVNINGFILAIGLNNGTGSGGAGTYNLNGGTLTIQDGVTLAVGYDTGSNGTLNQSGGTLNTTVGADFSIGGDGTGQNGSGQYNLTGGSANILGTMEVGNGTGSGTFTQSNGSTFTAAQSVDIGVEGSGTYKLTGGMADFQGGFQVGSMGLLTQSGGTLTTESGATITGTYMMTGGIATFSSLNVAGDMELNGGTLQVAEDQISSSGVFNLGGGTLKLLTGGSTTFTYSLVGSFTGGTSTIDTSASNITTVDFANPLVGAGGIAYVGNGSTQFNYTMANSYTGLTSIQSGTLNTIQDGIANSSGLNIGSSGVVNLNLSSGGFGFTGALSGSGLLNVNFATAGDALVLPSANGYDGAIVLGANGTRGQLQIYNGSYTDITDNGTNSGVTIGGTPLVTTGGQIPASGTVILSGANSYTGATTINPNFTVMASTFSGDVNNSGILATLGTQTAPAEMTIAGVLTSTGTIHVFTNGVTADLYMLNSASPSTLSGVIDAHGTGSGTYTIVTTAGAGDLQIGGNGHLNDAGGLTTSPPTSLFSATLVESADDSTLYLATRQGLLSTYATNPTQLAVANALDPLTQTPPPEFVPLLAIFNSLTGPQISQLEEDLAPTQLQVVRNIAFENSTFLVQRIDNTLGDIRSGYTGLDLNGIGYTVPGFSSGLARSLNSMLASNAPSFHTAAPNGVNYYPDGGGSSAAPSSDYSEPSSSPSRMTPSQAASPTSYDGQVLSDSPVPMRTSEPPTLRTSRFTEFVAGDAILADLDQTNNMPNKASYTAGDVMAGVGFRVTSNLTVGVLFDFNHTDAKTDGMGSKTTANSYTPGLFATFYEKDFYLNGLFAFGYNQYDYNQVVPMIGTAHGNPDGQQYTANIDGGYDFHPDKNWVVGPQAGLTYTHLDVNSFSESGAPLANLNVSSQSVDSLRSRLGGHLGYAANMGNVVFQPSISALWQHEFLDNGPGITSSFATYSTAGPFTIPVASPTKDSALLSVGATATLNNSLCFYLNYTADVGPDYLANSIMGGVKASF